MNPRENSPLDFWKGYFAIFGSLKGRLAFSDKQLVRREGATLKAGMMERRNDGKEK